MGKEGVKRGVKQVGKGAECEGFDRKRGRKDTQEAEAKRQQGRSRGARCDAQRRGAAVAIWGGAISLGGRSWLEAEGSWVGESALVGAFVGGPYRPHGRAPILGGSVYSW